MSTAKLRLKRKNGTGRDLKLSDYAQRVVDNNPVIVVEGVHYAFKSRFAGKQYLYEECPMPAMLDLSHTEPWKDWP